MQNLATKSSRPRRSAAQRATEAITDMADRDSSTNNMSRPGARAARGNASVLVSRGQVSSPVSNDGGSHMNLNIKVPANKLRELTGGGRRNGGGGGGDAGPLSRGETVKRAARAGNKSYVVESDSDVDDDNDMEEDEETDEMDTRAMDEDDQDDAMDDAGEEDAEGEEIDEDEMDVDAAGEEDDAEGEDDDAPLMPRPAIKTSKPASKTASRPSKSAPEFKLKSKAAHITSKSVVKGEDDDDDLSELDSERNDMNETTVVGGEDDAEGEEDDMDAEGEMEAADLDAEGEDEELPDSDGDCFGAPDMSRMTARQRAKHGDASHEYRKLSDEVQVKKHFTAEELSMRRAEMARRRRNLSEKRNEEVKMETINKLLKKQAPKTTKKMAMAGDETPGGGPDTEQSSLSAMFVRSICSKDGTKVAVPEKMLAGPMADVFGVKRFVATKMET